MIFDISNCIILQVWKECTGYSTSELKNEIFEMRCTFFRIERIRRFFDEHNISTKCFELGVSFCSLGTKNMGYLTNEIKE